MADHPRFGPAGVPPAFMLKKVDLTVVPEFLREEGLDAFEYEAVHWGTKPRIRNEEAEALGMNAKKNDVWLSVHGSYYMNFCGTRQIVEASKQRLVACAEAAEWMHAHVIIFHPGFYMGHSAKEALAKCMKALRDSIETIQNLGIGDVKIGPETMGRRYQLGTLSEVMTLCEELPQTQLVIDWAHLHAREQGRFRTVDDFRKVVEEVENRLGTEVVKNMHCHFTKIEFTSRGEKRHHTLNESNYGPKFEMLAKVISEYKLKPVIISESPLLDIDATKMRDILQKEWRKS